VVRTLHVVSARDSRTGALGGAPAEAADGEATRADDAADTSDGDNVDANGTNDANDMDDGNGNGGERSAAPAENGAATARRRATSANGSSAAAANDAATTERPIRRSLLASTLLRELRGLDPDDPDGDERDGAAGGDGHRTDLASGMPNGDVVVDRTTDLPEIVPATFDVPETVVAAPAPSLDVDDPEEWVELPEDTVVRVPRDGRTVPLRPVGRRQRVRKVTRVLRHIDPWSTFKVALIFSAILYAVLLTAGVLLWNVALNTGTVDNIERWFTQFGWETFELNGGEIYHNAWIAGLFGMLGLTGFGVLCATLFNLVSDIVGGVRMTVLEEEVVERTISPSRRFVVRRAPIPAAWDPEPVEEAAT
jgi:Transmembrane domain of unknown function (DUF3566)